LHIKTIVWVILGFLFLALGAVGLLLPVWPTTPFVLVTAACFSRTPRLRARVMNVSFFREYLHCYHQKSGLSLKTVGISLGYLWGMLLLSMVLISKWWLLVFLNAVGIAVSFHILMMATNCNAAKHSGKSRLFGLVEAVFDMDYLVLALLCGFKLLLTAGESTPRALAGIMALTLALGDAFHLLPRVAVILTQREEPMRRALGRGKQITSITMTVFYLLLWHVGLLIFAPAGIAPWSYAVYLLAFVRIILCLLPQNKWLERRPPLRWGILRNIPFFLLGLLVSGLFFVFHGAPGAPSLMWLAILLSFGFYLPVVLWSNKHPKIGMLMLPKTCAYLWMLMMCFSFQ
jgi:uncharacterized membrane protein YbaN (DUF454 family)